RSRQDNNGQTSLSSSSSVTFPDNLINECQGETTQILGSCDGLVLIGIYGFRYICLINPTTGVHRTLSPELLQWPIHNYGFRSGVNSPTITKDRTLFQGYTTFFENSIFMELDILINRFSVKVISFDDGEQRDAGWYDLEDYKVCNEQTPVYANGSLFWLTLYYFTFEYKTFSELPSHLLAIDLHTEQFRWVSLPKCYIRYSRGVQMWSLNEHVWSLQREEYSTQNWEKLFSFNILNISRLDAKCWMLGLRAAYFRMIEKGQDQVSFDSLKTAIWYSPTMISPSSLL
ncbi:hypothetical protein CARUB_v10019519mg, partial [Capsella rubella]